MLMLANVQCGGLYSCMYNEGKLRTVLPTVSKYFAYPRGNIKTKRDNKYTQTCKAYGRHVSRTSEMQC